MALRAEAQAARLAKRRHPFGREHTDEPAVFRVVFTDSGDGIWRAERPFAGDDDVRNKLTTGNGNRWTRERVTSLRSHHKIPVHRPADGGIEPWLNLTKAATHLGISAKTLRIAAENAEIEGVHPLPDGPWIFSRATLDGSAAQALAARAHGTATYPAGLGLGQQNLFSSSA
jgi:hypothetical protein